MILSRYLLILSSQVTTLISSHSFCDMTVRGYDVSEVWSLTLVHGPNFYIHAVPPPY